MIADFQDMSGKKYFAKQHKHTGLEVSLLVAPLATLLQAVRVVT
jgi:hypothetical protein